MIHKASHKRPLCLIAADIDYFKQINDQYGHLNGDKVLQKVAELLKELKAEGDLVVRCGGEERLRSGAPRGARAPGGCEEPCEG
jgi:diguanylate cyclase (GGDEF)-like protein